MTDSLARARELVTPEMMSEVFAASVRRKDPDHPHLYDHRIGAEKMNELLKPLLDTAVREARVQALEDAATECDRHAEFLAKEPHNGGYFGYLIERLDEASYLAARLRFLKGQP